MEPTYVTFEQAKWLKEKGFDEECKNVYYGDTEDDDLLQNNEPVTPSSDYILGEWDCYAPEQHQVVEWLRINHEIEVSALRYTFSKGKFVGKKYMFLVEKYKKNFNPDLDEYHFEEEPLESSRELNYNSPQEAYSAAFDYIISNNLI